jgi:hypothetical protein
MKKEKKIVASKEENPSLFFTALCASRKIKVSGKIDKPIQGTIKVFNAYHTKEKFDKCTGKHYEVFQSLIGQTVKAFGLSCTFEQGEKVADRFMILDKVPQGLEDKIK